MSTYSLQPICFTSSDGRRQYGLVLETDEPTGMLFVQWCAQRERLAGIPHANKVDWQRYGPRQGWVRVDAEQRHGAKLELVTWDELPSDVQDQLRRLAERVG